MTAHADLLVSLVRAGVAGDRERLDSTVNMLIAAERAKRHHRLADRLQEAWRSGTPGAAATPLDKSVRDLLQAPAAVRTLDDLVLPEGCRRACEQLIDEQRQAARLRNHSLEPRHRLLLVGPPGNSKTSLAEAIAQALGYDFLVLRYETVVDSYLGETASRLSKVFDYVRQAPCLLFFDEFDAVGKSRGDWQEVGEIKRVVTSLLLQIDAVPSYTVVVAASNHAELLDRAIWRRFQFRLTLPPPTRAGLVSYVRRFQESLGEPLGLAPEIVADALDGASFSEAEEWCLAVRRQRILSDSTASLRSIASEQIGLWQTRASAVDTPRWRPCAEVSQLA